MLPHCANNHGTGTKLELDRVANQNLLNYKKKKNLHDGQRVWWCNGQRGSGLYECTWVQKEYIFMVVYRGGIAREDCISMLSLWHASHCSVKVVNLLTGT